MNKPDFDADDLEFKRQLDTTLSEVRSRVGPCPDPDLLMAAVSGVQTESGEHVLRHLDLCPICQDLRRNLTAYEYPAISAEEDQRIRSRWAKASADTARRHSRWAWLWK